MAMWQREGASRDSVYIPLWAEARFAGPAHPRAPVLSSWIGCSDLPQQSRSALTVDGRSRAALRVSSLTQVRSAQDSTVIYSFKSLVFSCCARARVFVKEGGGVASVERKPWDPSSGFTSERKKRRRKRKKLHQKLFEQPGVPPEAPRPRAARRREEPPEAPRPRGAARRREEPPVGCERPAHWSWALPGVWAASQGWSLFSSSDDVDDDDDDDDEDYDVLYSFFKIIKWSSCEAAACHM